MVIKGELFSQQFIPKLLDETKTQTSRPVKRKYSNTHIQWLSNKYGTSLVEVQNDIEGETFWKNPDGTTTHKLLACRELKPKYRPGNIMYARETLYQSPTHGGWRYLDEVGENSKIKTCWKKTPSIHMPREAARIFLRVTGVKAQRINDLTEKDAIEDGFAPTFSEAINGGIVCNSGWITAMEHFKDFWLSRYGPDAQWMWVYYFKKISKEEAYGQD
jgi:hypothetical protein